MTSSSFEIETGLRASVEPEASSYIARLQARAEEIRKTQVSVLMFGPGRSSNKHLQKRQQVRQHLTSLNENNFVETGESIDEQVPELAQTLSLADREEIAVVEADLIFVLLASEHQATGPEAEILAYARNRRTREKTYIFLPKDWNKSGFLADAVASFPEEHKYWMTFKQIEECTRIRSFCEQKVKEVRGEKYMVRRRVQDLLR